MINVDELIKCKNDIVYFAEKYLQRYDLYNGNLVPMELYPYQQQILTEDRVISRTSRQIGYTLMSCIKIVHSIIFEHDKTIVIYGNNMQSVSANLRTIEQLLDNNTLTRDIKYTSRQKTKLEFDNGNRVIATSTRQNLKGYSISELHIQEVDFIQEPIHELMCTVFPTLVATSNYKLWAWSNLATGKLEELELNIKRNDKNGEFTYHTLPWYVIPNRNSKWKSNVINNISKERFDIEYNNRV